MVTIVERCSWSLVLQRLVLLSSMLAFAGTIALAADKGLNFSGQDLPGKSFAKQILENANFEDAELKSANFGNAVATGANFQGANLSHATFAQADLTNCDFRGARLSYTSFYMATMNGANLEKADLSLNGGLSYVKLKKANLRNLKGISAVSEVDFTEADLRGANLVGMTILGDTSKFRKAKYDSKTRWPKGFDVESSGAILTEEPDPVPEEKPKPGPGKIVPAKDLEKEFAALDTNEDGRLSGKEMKGLEDLDKNKDGRVTLEEFLAGRKK